jgi:hypothetical protein
VSVSKTKGRAKINKTSNVVSDTKMLNYNLLIDLIDHPETVELQPENKGGFSTESDPMPPDSMGMGVDMRDAHELSNNFLGMKLLWSNKHGDCYLDDTPIVVNNFRDFLNEIQIFEKV